MQFPWYKKCLSYFYEIPIEERTSSFSKKLSVSLHKGRIKLSTEKAIYSEADHYFNFVEVFRKIEFNPDQIYHILVLGLGLGSIPYMLQKKFNIQANYDLVEIDPVVIHLFNHYVKSEISGNCNVIQMDAKKFVELDKNSYDILCIDLFIDRVIPTEFNREEFIASLRQRISPNGFIVFNRLTETTEDRMNDEKFGLLFKKYFTDCKVVPVLSNSMYIGKI